MHIGFLDSPFLEEKYLHSSMLHSKLMPKSAFLYGIDVNVADMGKYRSLTEDENNTVMDLSERNVGISGLKDAQFDVVLISEVLEHISNPGIFLKNLYEICKENDSSLLVTVPNSFNLDFFIEANDSREIVHPEHYFYFSPITIKRLLESESFVVKKTLMYTPGGRGGYDGITQ